MNIKKNKKGFTLIEILSVIILLGIILTVVTTIGLNAFGNSKEKIFEQTKTELEKAAKVVLNDIDICDDDLDTELLESDLISDSNVNCSTLKEKARDCINVPIDYLIDHEYITGNNVLEVENTNPNMKFEICLEDKTAECIEDCEYKKTNIKTTSEKTSEQPIKPSDYKLVLIGDTEEEFTLPESSDREYIKDIKTQYGSVDNYVVSKFDPGIKIEYKTDKSLEPIQLLEGKDYKITHEFIKEDYKLIYTYEVDETKYNLETNKITRTVNIIDNSAPVILEDNTKYDEYDIMTQDIWERYEMDPMNETTIHNFYGIPNKKVTDKETTLYLTQFDNYDGESTYEFTYKYKDTFNLEIYNNYRLGNLKENPFDASEQRTPIIVEDNKGNTNNVVNFVIVYNVKPEIIFKKDYDYINQIFNSYGYKYYTEDMNIISDIMKEISDNVEFFDADNNIAWNEYFISNKNYDWWADGCVINSGGDYIKYPDNRCNIFESGNYNLKLYSFDEYNRDTDIASKLIIPFYVDNYYYNEYYNIGYNYGLSNGWTNAYESGRSECYNLKYNISYDPYYINEYGPTYYEITDESDRNAYLEGYNAGFNYYCYGCGDVELSQAYEAGAKDCTAPDNSNLEEQLQQPPQEDYCNETCIESNPGGGGGFTYIECKSSCA